MHFIFLCLCVIIADSALTRHFKQSIRCGPQLITITRTPPLGFYSHGLIQRWAEFFGRIHILAQNRISPNNSAHLWFNSALGRGQLLALTPWHDEDTMRTISIPDCDLHCSLHSAACLLWQDNFICMWAAGQSCSNQDSTHTTKYLYPGGGGGHSFPKCGFEGLK